MLGGTITFQQISRPPAPREINLGKFGFEAVVQVGRSASEPACFTSRNLDFRSFWPKRVGRRAINFLASPDSWNFFALWASLLEITGGILGPPSMSLNGVLGEAFAAGLWRPAPRRPSSILQAALAPGPLDVMPFRLGMPMEWAGAVPPVPVVTRVVEPEPATPVAVPAPTTIVPKPQSKSARLAPSAEDAADRRKVLSSWTEILIRLGCATDAYDKCGGEFSESKVQVFMAPKATGTLAIRASAWCLFLRYAEANDLDPSKFDEAAAFSYLTAIAADPKIAQSRGPSFLCAVNFLRGCCGLKAGFQVADSGRCKGASALSVAETRLAKQRDPLRASWIRAAEAEIVLADEGGGDLGLLTPPEAEMLGFLMFCLHTRARCSDTSRIKVEPKLDEHFLADPICSFVETMAIGGATKTGQTAKKARLSIPIVGLSRGLSDVPWAASWLNIRKTLGLNAERDECLQRELLADGSFGAGRVLPGQATTWLRFILIKMGVESALLENVGSHSCKVSLLSMAAKAGMSRDDRRTLGGHVAPNDKTVDIYARDVLAAPLRNLAFLLSDIREGIFDPDVSRSGRYSQRRSDDLCMICKDDIAKSPSFRCNCGNWAHSDCSVRCHVCLGEFCMSCDNYTRHTCREPETVAQEILEESGSDWDSEDDSDVEQARMTLEQVEAAEAEVAQERAFLEKGASADDALMPENGVFVHLVHRTAHRACDEGFTACGVVVSDLTHEYLSGDDDFSHSKLCWRSGCCPWQQRPPIVEVSESESDGFSVLNEAS